MNVEDADEGSEARGTAYVGEHTPAAGHTVESTRAWNSWWDANFHIATENLLIPALGDAMGMIAKELRDEVKQLRELVTKLERELEQARADGVVALPRSGWKSNAA